MADRGDENLILLVEDDPNDILLMGHAITRAELEHAVSVVRDGEEAIAFLAAHSADPPRDRAPLPRLILLDLKLPKKSGFDVLRWLRTQPRLRPIPVVVLTSSNERADVERAYELGANSYIVKPTGFNQLLETVRMLKLYWHELNASPPVGQDDR
jgi:CheY-like chemotaxis protein